MASSAAEEAIDGYLRASWPHGDECPIFVENEDEATPDDGSPFLVLQFPLSTVSRVSVATPLYREEGGFRIIINVERGQGMAKIREYGVTLATLFRDRQIGPVSCRVPSEPFTDDQSDQGNYFQGSMVVPYDMSFTS
jgi:hypothetical protein